MKKNSNKPTDQKEYLPDQPGSGNKSAREQHPNNKPIVTSVDWEIPGDVPEEHRRSITPYAPAVKPIKPDSEKIVTAAPGNSGRTNASTNQTPHPSIQSQTNNSRQRRFSFPLPGLIILLLMLGLGGLGYLYFSGDNEKLVAANSENQDMDKSVDAEDAAMVVQAESIGVADKTVNPADQDVQVEVAGNPQEAAESVQETRIITHVVKKGDTLWDIAEYYVDDPFRYPELAELSKIQNPDLIYPGDIVRIRV